MSQFPNVYMRLTQYPIEQNDGKFNYMHVGTKLKFFIVIGNNKHRQKEYMVEAEDMEALKEEARKLVISLQKKKLLG